uniref:Immunoglobulin V-set domain-containing protein n=1 Tax=Periophthalmus magnuspinnatus TaxID=409849 RepID=A0A3B4B082_9GOBI
MCREFSLSTCIYLYIYLTGTISKQIFIQTNHNLELHVSNSQIQTGAFFWKFNGSRSIITMYPDKSKYTGSEYKDRVEFLPQNLSLILKNLQLNDTGCYTAVASKDKDSILDTFFITVEGEFKHMSIIITNTEINLISSMLSPQPHCTTEVYNISRSFTCDTQSCEPHPQTPGPTEQPHPQTPGPTFLDLKRSKDSIICNHSNHVSWTIVTRNYRELCPKGNEAKANL